MHQKLVGHMDLGLLRELSRGPWTTTTHSVCASGSTLAPFQWLADRPDARWRDDVVDIVDFTSDSTPKRGPSVDRDHHNYAA
ncbi:hypothetical protein [Streptomyces europaeiscabiei]|uniref:hypothetical protein n=1 Tax=Streptomyces europaeiscabiei TaxID=146819 RepID=UPI0029B1A423|nr:hypothetical protein [Streptomyces europaeiscabiei]MDX2525308.1 hypothetical protein [Streptomyces europaeiscabiei]